MPKRRNPPEATSGNPNKTISPTKIPNSPGSKNLLAENSPDPNRFTAGAAMNPALQERFKGIAALCSEAAASKDRRLHTLTIQLLDTSVLDLLRLQMQSMEAK